MLGKRLFILIFSSSVSISIGLNEPLNVSPLKECLSPECIKTSADLLNSMNLNVNPCEDFYEFACGKFNDNVVMEDHLEEKSKFSIMQKNLDWKLKNLLEEESVESDPRVYKSVRNLYYEYGGN